MREKESAGPRGCARWRVRAVAAALLGWIGLATSPSLAWESDYGAGTSLAHQSNVTRSASNPRSDWITTLFGGVAFEERDVDFNGNLLAQMEVRNYMRDVYPDDRAFYLNGFAVWDLSPRVMTWSVEELYREALIDLTQPDVPTNRTKNNTLSTGPNVTLNPDAANSMQLGGRISRYDVRGTGDNFRRSAYWRLLRRLRDPTTWSVNYEVVRVNFTDPGTTEPQVLREDWYARFDESTFPNRATLDVGRTRVTREGRESLEGKLLRLTFARRLSFDATVQASYEEQYSDTFTDSLRWVTSPSVPGGITVVPPGGSVVAGDAYYGRRGNLVYRYGELGAGASFGVAAYANNIDYLTTSPDYQERGARLDVGARPWGPGRLYASATFNKREFPAIDQTDVDRYAVLGAIYGLTRNVSLTLEGSRLSRSGNGPLGSYVDWRGMLQLAYSSGRLYTPSSRR